MPPCRFLPAAKTEFTERTIHNSTGLGVSTLLTLFIVPVLLLWLMQPKRPAL
jgi:multidrug efflux pump subunit AcrB